MRRDKPTEQLRQLGLLLQIPGVLGAGPLVGYFVGSTLDRWLGTDPWFMTGSLILGTIAGARLMLQILRKAGMM